MTIEKRSTINDLDPLAEVSGTANFAVQTADGVTGRSTIAGLIASATAAAQAAIVGAAPADLDTLAKLAAALNTLIGVVTGALVFKGGWDASAGTFPASADTKTGWFYKATVGGTVNGVLFDAGDEVFAIVDAPSGAIYAGNWLRVEGAISLAEVQAAVGFVFGNAASKTVGTAAGNVVALDGSAKLPAVDGSQLTNTGAVRYDTVQTLTATQAAQARGNTSTGAFKAHKNGADQTGIVGNNVTFTQITFGTIVFNTGNFFASSAYTPPPALVSLDAQALVTGTFAVGKPITLGLFKNGVLVDEGFGRAVSANEALVLYHCDIVASGSDVFDIRVRGAADSGTLTVSGDTRWTRFSGKVI